MIELTDTNSSAIAAEFVRARTRAGSPAMGMVMTLIVVVDEDNAEAAMDNARKATHEHPARVLGVVLGDGRGAAVGQRPGRHRRRLGRRGRGHPARGRGGQARRLRGAAAAAARLPRRDLVAARSARRPGRRPARAARQAADHRRRRGHPRQDQGAGGAVRVVRRRQHRPGLDPAHALACAARRGARPAPAEGHLGEGRSPSGSAPAPTCSPPGCGTGCGSRSRGRAPTGPGITEVVHGDQGGPDPDLPRRRPARDVHLARTVPTGRSR